MSLALYRVATSQSPCQSSEIETSCHSPLLDSSPLFISAEDWCDEIQRYTRPPYLTISSTLYHVTGVQSVVQFSVLSCVAHNVFSSIRSSIANNCSGASGVLGIPVKGSTGIEGDVCAHEHTYTLPPSFTTSPSL